MGIHRSQVAIGGYGAVGRTIASRIVDGLPGYELSALAARREGRLRDELNRLKWDVDVVPIEDLANHADIVIESVPAAAFRHLAEPVVRSGKVLVTLSAGALLDHWDLVELAEQTGAVIHVPSGAIAGLDGLQGLAQGSIESVHIESRKPPEGLKGAPLVEQEKVHLDNDMDAQLLFRGTAREAVRGFPANLNVAVAVALAGAGPDKTTIEVWADPSVVRNTHHVHAVADAGRLSITIENVPSENPKTGKLTALSVIALLEKWTTGLRIGT